MYFLSDVLIIEKLLEGREILYFLFQNRLCYYLAFIHCSGTVITLTLRDPKQGQCLCLSAFVQSRDSPCPKDLKI